MGYAFYHLDGMDRGYSVPDRCNASGCDVEIDRGLSYLCYRCLRYFCGHHLALSDFAFDCFAGESGQVCLACLTEEEQSGDAEEVVA